jgi:mannose-6-phosphate isomerase class I
MVTSENGLILSDVNHHLIEISWDIFYSSQSNRILGNDLHYRLFHGANDFPIRLNFLDTMDGGCLPIQCNPSLAYIRTNFGEKFTQDETYYIIETKQHWKEEYQNDSYIYLGFQEHVNPEEFHRDLITSENIEKYIQYIPTNIHEFFLIPNETIHASGPNQVILEISTTPYMYLFKLYDWLRLGLDGRPCTLNIEHGMKNLRFDRHAEKLHCQPISLQIEEDKYEEQHLPTHSLHYYDVYRLIIEGNKNIEIIRFTENRFHLCMLVEGDAIEIEYYSMEEKQIRQYNYIESFLIPASINEYRLRPIIKNKDCEKKSQQFILLITFLKWNCEKLLE